MTFRQGNMAQAHREGRADVAFANMEPVPDRPVLRAGDDLVVADLHIGKEEELRREGFTLPSQTKKMAEEIASIMRELRPKRLVILGDLKHEIPRFTGLERRDVPRFFDLLEGVAPEVHLVQGNHDGNIAYLLPRWVTLHGPEGYRRDDIAYIHGHAWPSPEIMEARTLLMGHNHPTLLFPDRLGPRTYERCWVRAPFIAGHPRYPRHPEDLVLVPAFNEFSGGTPVNERGRRFLGPILKSSMVGMEGAQVYLLNGTYLGRLEGMMVERRARKGSGRPRPPDQGSEGQDPPASAEGDGPGRD
ncbi:MAG: metallophosphoesterase [Thermoplasmata archaeon]